MDCNRSSYALARRPASHRTFGGWALGLAFTLGLPVTGFAQAPDPASGQPSSATRHSQRADPVPAPIVPDNADALQSATAQNNLVRPEKREHSEALLQQIQLPEGFRISVFAEGLTNPRIIEVSPRGDIYVTEREAGRVTILRDRNRDGKADQVFAAASGLGEGLQGVHGLATAPDGETLYMVTDTELYRASIQFDGRLDEPELILADLPEAGQHPNRTMEFGPDGLLYLSIGSSTNAVSEPNKLMATLVRFDPEQPDLTTEDLEIYAEGLRNTIGFGWSPLNQQLYGWDHSSDGRGDDWPPEEINQIREGAHYGWPFCGGDRVVDLHVSGAPEGSSKVAFCPETEAPLLNYQSHVAGMQWQYYTGQQFPEEYQNDAFVTLRGSWNRNPPVGYEILRIRHDQSGVPIAAEPFATGWLLEPVSAPGHFGRLSGLAQAPDGSLLVANDSHGVIYRISYEGAAGAAPSSPGQTPNPGETPMPVEPQPFGAPPSPGGPSANDQVPRRPTSP